MPSGQPDDTDRIAHEAARLYETGAMASLRDAIDYAIETTGLLDAARPSVGRVRQHVQAMAMQALGDVGYQQRVHGILSIADLLMAALEETLDGVTPLLVGRAARGQVDGPTKLHIRLYTELPVDVLADALVQLGYDEPRFETPNSRHGRLNRLIITEEGVEVVLTRCPPRLRADAHQNLFTGERVDVATSDDLRDLLSTLQ